MVRGPDNIEIKMPKAQKQTIAKKAKDTELPVTLPKVRQTRAVALKSRPSDNAVDLKSTSLKSVTPSKTKVVGLPSPSNKQAALLSLLRRPEGASLSELCEASGWQAHSMRGFLSGTVRTKLGLRLESIVGERGRIYRIADEPNPAQDRSIRTLGTSSSLTGGVV